MLGLERSLSRHGIEISGWLLHPSGRPEEDAPDAVRVSGTESFEPDAGDRLQDHISPPLLLPNALGAALRRFAEELGDPAEAYYLVLLCVAASLIPSKTRLLVNPRTDYSEPPILWGGLMGDASDGQSRILGTLINPLRDLQTELYVRYQQQLEAYEMALQEHERKREIRATGDPPDHPTLVELYTSECKAEAVFQILARQPERGLLIDLDDLGIFLRSSGARPRGRRDDSTRWWMLYQGAALKKRSGTTVCTLAPHPSISVIGRIRYYALRELWSGCKRHGMDIRPFFAWVRVPIRSYTANQEIPPHGLRRLLEAVYRRLQASPPMQHVLDEEGHQRWSNWIEDIHSLIRDERDHKIRLILNETLGRAVRIALVLHRLDAACIGVIPSVIVPASTLDRGMDFAMSLLCYAENLLSS